MYETMTLALYIFFICVAFILIATTVLAVKLFGAVAEEKRAKRRRRSFIKKLFHKEMEELRLPPQLMLVELTTKPRGRGSEVVFSFNREATYAEVVAFCLAHQNEWWAEKYDMSSIGYVNDFHDEELELLTEAGQWHLVLWR